MTKKLHHKISYPQCVYAALKNYSLTFVSDEKRTKSRKLTLCGQKNEILKFGQKSDEIEHLIA